MNSDEKEDDVCCGVNHLTIVYFGSMVNITLQLSSPQSRTATKTSSSPSLSRTQTNSLTHKRGVSIPRTTRTEVGKSFHSCFMIIISILGLLSKSARSFPVNSNTRIVNTGCIRRDISIKLRPTPYYTIASTKYQLHRPFATKIFASTEKYKTEENSSSIATTTIHTMTEESTTSTKAKLVSCTDESLSKCGERIRSEELVSFPTETVYGLGCNALSPTAVLKVFEAKKRPLTDPLIVHVLDTEAALPLWDFSSNGGELKSVLTTLTQHFFPGPLTLVSKSNTKVVPDIITAGTGYVAIRSPSHPIARRLIELSERPIAAPSANRFGHVSPTKAFHVMNDLANENVWVVSSSENIDNGTSTAESDNASSCTCEVGVESTVAKVDEQTKTISILRQGAVSAKDIQQCLLKNDLEKLGYIVDVKVKSTSEQVANIAPGQTVRHYSPDVLSFMISENWWKNSSSSINGKTSHSDDDLKKRIHGNDLNGGSPTLLSRSVILDFGGRLSFLKEFGDSGCLAYRDLSAKGDSREGASNVFEYLRWAENVEDAERVFFPEIDVNDEDTDALTLALKDRLTRAASGVVIEELQ